MGNDRTTLTVALLRCGAFAGPIFVATFLVAGAVRPGYDALRHPVSSLALGPDGWVQAANFAVAGALYLALAVGLLRARSGSVAPRSVAVLVGLVAVGLLGAAAFVTDPVGGYSPGIPPDAAKTTNGALHDGFSVFVFLGLPAAAVVHGVSSARRGDLRWAGYSLGSALVFVVAFVLASAAFGQSPELVRYGGLLQRVAIMVGFTWLTLLSLRALRLLPRSPR